jgi:hypothetical protein
VTILKKESTMKVHTILASICLFNFAFSAFAEDSSQPQEKPPVDEKQQVIQGEKKGEVVPEKIECDKNLIPKGAEGKKACEIKDKNLKKKQPSPVKNRQLWNN